MISDTLGGECFVMLLPELKYTVVANEFRVFTMDKIATTTMPTDTFRFLERQLFGHIDRANIQL